MKSAIKTFRIERKPPNVTPSRRLALIIGNANYVYGGSLANPINDASAITRRCSGLGLL